MHLSAEIIEKLECLGNWVKNDLIRKLYVVVDDEIMDISEDHDEIFLSQLILLIILKLIMDMNIRA